MNDGPSTRNLQPLPWLHDNAYQAAIKIQKTFKDYFQFSYDRAEWHEFSLFLLLCAYRFCSCGILWLLLNTFNYIMYVIIVFSINNLHDRFNLMPTFSHAFLYSMRAYHLWWKGPNNNSCTVQITKILPYPLKAKNYPRYFLSPSLYIISLVCKHFSKTL